jgi:hypothetical protein
VRDRLRINAEFGKKYLANDKVLKSINSKMNNFTMVVQNERSFNKLLETHITQLASALPHPNGRGFLHQPATPDKENVKAMVTRSGKTVVEPKATPKITTPIEPDEEEEEADAKVEAEPRAQKERVNLGKASPRDVSDIHLLPFPRHMKKLVEDEKFSHFVDVIRKMYDHIPLLDTMQVSTNAKYLKDILNQK